MKSFFYVSFLTLLLFAGQAIAQPQFNSGQDPKPNGKDWSKVNNLSDEFDGSTLDTQKWQNGDPNRWVGRAPGLFKNNTVSVSGGKMNITNYKLSSPETVNGQTFTHACGHVISKNKATQGHYVESRMKANKTFLSSTFWLINYKNEGTGCDQRVTELDIQECVGYINSTANWTQSFDETMHSNTHSRNVSCNTPTGSIGNNASTSGKVYDAYHTYGAWWKSATEVLFYLDGVYQYTVTPKADFSIDMYIKLVTETYDWNPAPADGGMTGSWADRTTFYDWVRVWELVDAPDTPTTTETVALNNAPSSVTSQNSYSLTVDYTANQSRDIIVEMWNTGWLGSAKATVAAGSGSKTITINMANAPAAGTNYIWKTSIRPVNTTWQSNIANAQQTNVTVTTASTQVMADGDYEIRSMGNNYNLGATSWSNWEAVDVVPAAYNDQKWTVKHLGNDVYSLKLVATYGGTKYLEVPNSACANGTKVGTGSSANSTNQQWKIVKNGSYYQLKPNHCQTQALDVRPDDDRIHTWTSSTTNNNQKWSFVLVKKSAVIGNSITPQVSAIQLQVYPNPTSDMVTVQTDNSDRVSTLQVYDLQGKLQLERQLIDANYQLNVKSRFGTGVYILRVTNGVNSVNQKLVIQ